MVEKKIIRTWRIARDYVPDYIDPNAPVEMVYHDKIIYTRQFQPNVKDEK